MFVSVKRTAQLVERTNNNFIVWCPCKFTMFFYFSQLSRNRCVRFASWGSHDISTLEPTLLFQRLSRHETISEIRLSAVSTVHPNDFRDSVFHLLSTYLLFHPMICTQIVIITYVITANPEWWPLILYYIGRRQRLRFKACGCGSSNLPESRKHHPTTQKRATEFRYNLVVVR